jgi:hypothetical protein
VTVQFSVFTLIGVFSNEQDPSKEAVVRLSIRRRQKVTAARVAAARALKTNPHRADKEGNGKRPVAR